MSELWRFVLQQRSSKVTWNYTWNLTLLTSPGNLHLTLHLHYTFYSTIENFSACCNTSRGIKLVASQADRLRSAYSLAINISNSCFLLDICSCTGSLRIWPCFKEKYFHIRSRTKRNALFDVHVPFSKISSFILFPEFQSKRYSWFCMIGLGK